jgi:hypothetical protein
MDAQKGTTSALAAEAMALQQQVTDLEAMLAKVTARAVLAEVSAAKAASDIAAAKEAAPVEKVSRDDHEAILRKNPRRFVLLPIQHERLWEMASLRNASFCTPPGMDSECRLSALSCTVSSLFPAD